MKFSSFSSASASLLLAVASASASSLEERAVWAPKITKPKANDVWIPGQLYNVTWDNSNPPQDITSPKGRIVLKKGESLLLNAVLAEGFDLTRGWVEVTAPKNEQGSDYAVVLFGDSGNWSEVFSIKPNDGANAQNKTDEEDEDEDGEDEEDEGEGEGEGEGDEEDGDSESDDEDEEAEGEESEVDDEDDELDDDEDEGEFQGTIPPLLVQLSKKNTEAADKSV